MGDLYVWECERNSEHFVMTPVPNNAAVPGYSCPQCGGHLRGFKKFANDGRPRGGVNLDSAEKAITAQGYYAWSAGWHSAERVVKSPFFGK